MGRKVWSLVRGSMVAVARRQSVEIQIDEQWFVGSGCMIEPCNFVFEFSPLTFRKTVGIFERLDRVATTIQLLKQFDVLLSAWVDIPRWGVGRREDEKGSAGWSAKKGSQKDPREQNGENKSQRDADSQSST